MVWSHRLYFRVQLTGEIKVTWAWITAFAPHPCHGQFLVIQTWAGENLSDKPWSLLYDKKISIRFLRAKCFGYQAFLKKSSCILVPTVPGGKKKTLLYHYCSFLTKKGGVKESSEGINHHPQTRKLHCADSPKGPYLVISSQQGQHNSSCYCPWSGCKSVVQKQQRGTWVYRKAVCKAFQHVFNERHAK